MKWVVRLLTKQLNTISLCFLRQLATKLSPLSCSPPCAPPVLKQSILKKAKKALCVTN